MRDFFFWFATSKKGLAILWRVSKVGPMLTFLFLTIVAAKSEAYLLVYMFAFPLIWYTYVFCRAWYHGELRAVPDTNILTLFSDVNIKNYDEVYTNETDAKHKPKP